MCMSGFGIGMGLTAVTVRQIYRDLLEAPLVHGAVVDGAASLAIRGCHSEMASVLLGAETFSGFAS